MLSGYDSCQYNLCLALNLGLDRFFGVCVPGCNWAWCPGNLGITAIGKYTQPQLQRECPQSISRPTPDLEDRAIPSTQSISFPSPWYNAQAGCTTFPAIQRQLFGEIRLCGKWRPCRIHRAQKSYSRILRKSGRCQFASQLQSNHTRPGIGWTRYFWNRC